MPKHHTIKPIPSEILGAKRPNPIPGFDSDAYTRATNAGRHYTADDPVWGSRHPIDMLAAGMLGDRFQEARP